MNNIEDGGGDRLSNLPEALLVSIFSALPTKQAVSTSILSKRYRYLWHSVTHLQLLDENIFPTSDDDDRSAAQIWHTMLDSIELYVHGPVHSCRISFNPSYTYIPRLCTFLHFLIKKGIKELKIVNRGIGCYELPSILCPTLQKLELSKCVLSNTNEFTNIKSLVLFRVYFTNEQFESLVSSCVVLESMKVDCCVRVRHFKIRAPKLVWLEISSLKRIRISLMEVGCLKEASFRFQFEFEDMYLRYCDDSSKEEDDDQDKKLVRLFKDLSRCSVEILSFNFCTEFTECLQRQRAEIPASLPPQYQLQSVKKLDIEICLGNLQTATIISCMLHSCPNLEQLSLRVYYMLQNSELCKRKQMPAIVNLLCYADISYTCEVNLNLKQDKEHLDTAGNYWETQSPCVCLMNSLKIIEISKVNLQKSVWMRLVEYLLMNARICKRITIQYNDDDNMSLNLEQKLNMLQWANPDAVLDFVPLSSK